MGDFLKKLQKGKKYRPRKSFKEDLEALRLALPVAMHFQNVATGADSARQDYCHQASHCGVEVLRRLGYKAEVLPCAIIAQGRGWSCSVGHSRESSYEAYLKNQPNAPTLEQWVESNTSPWVNNEKPFHLVLEAWSPSNERAIADLSLGQLRLGGYKNCPSSIVWFGLGWPKFDTDDGGYILYEKCPHEIDPAWLQCTDLEEMIEFVLKAMDIAHQCKLDPKRFSEVISQSVRFT